MKHQAQPSHPMGGSVDHYIPAEIAGLIETNGVAKANASFVTTFVLGVLVGAFIGLGAVFATTVSAGFELGFGGLPGSGSRWA